ncbi:MAG: hypothetical protein KAJ51_11400 [Thermoplasmata archaeon]|nr:hypothetical protein [Thermoplasmata archaeon]
MSDILLYNRPMDSAFKDFMRVSSEKVEHTDYGSSDISTFVNDYFIFYVPPPNNWFLSRPTSYGGYTYKTGDYIVANLSSLQLFSYENGAEVTVEWLNGAALNGTTFDGASERWVLDNDATIQWLDDIQGPKKVKKTYKLGEYKSEVIQLNDWVVYDDFRLISGVVKITSDYPISVMHQKLYPLGTLDENGYEMINDNWDGIYSAYCKKLFTRITGDCWISALEANTEIKVWDYSDKNDDVTLNLDRFEGWDYSRNAIFEQYGFDDDLVLISADKPVSIVAGLQSDQCFTQMFGKDGKDYLFPCFGYVLIHAPNGATIDLQDKSGNQGSFKGTLDKGEMRVFDFKVAYKLRRYSSFEWAQLMSSEPVLVYTMANNLWYLNEDDYGEISGEEYFTTYKKTTELYSHGYIPYPADTEFTIPIRSRAYVTVVNPDKNKNDVEIDFSDLIKPFKQKLKPYQAVTIDFSEDSYYPMDMINPHTQTKEEPKWLYSDPRNRYALDHMPTIAIHEDDENTFTQKVSWENITKGSTVKVKSSKPVLVFINYIKDQSYYPQGVDLIPGLTPPTRRSLPEFHTMVVVISGLIIAVDMIIVAVGRRSIVEVFKD